MSITFPGESPEYRAARDRLLEQEIELRRATEAVAAARRELPPGGAVPEDYVFQGAGRGRRADRGEAVGAVRARQGHPRDLQLHVPPRPRRRPPGARRPARRRCCRWRRARARHAWRCSTSSTAPPSTRPSRSTSRSSPRRRSRGSSPSPRSAAGGGCGCCPRPPTPTTATTTARPPRETSGRCSTCSTATARRSATSGARSSSTRRPTPIRIPATSAPSSRSGTCSTSPPRDGRADWDEQLSYR